MSSLPLALCITDLEPGGAERCLTELAVRADRRRFEPVVYCLAPRPGPGRDECVRRLEAASVPVHFLGARGFWHLPRTLWRLRRLLARQRPSVVQTFLFHANILGPLAAGAAGRPSVVSGIRVAESTRRWRQRWERWTGRFVDRHVCVSQGVARFAQQQMGLPAEKLVVIPNGVDLQKFPARPAADLASFGVRPGQRLITYVGRLDAQKGVDWLLRAAVQFLAQVPQCDLAIVGTGPEAQRLQQQVAANRLTDRVHFLGWRSDVAEILAASVLLVLPSRWEGMPNVVLEAMASGLPVVATSVEGVEDLLGASAGEQTVAFGETEMLVCKLLALLNDAAHAAELGHANRRLVEEFFTLERMVSAYENLWLSLVK